MVFGVFCFWCFFLKGLKGCSPPPNGNMKPFVLLSSPSSVTTTLPSLPSRAPFPAAFTHFACWSSAFRQPQHSSVWTVTNSCTLDTPPRFAVSLPQCPRPVCSPISAWEFGVWNVFWLLGRGSSPYHPQCGVMRRERRIFIRNWFCVANFLLCFFLFLFICFGLSVQDLQLLKSALPLIKPCSLQPDLCRDCFFPILKENPT